MIQKIKGDMDMKKVENIEATEEMKKQEAEMLGEQAEGQQEAETERQQEEARELAEAQRTGVVDMSDKGAKKGKKNPNYTHTFSKPIEILGKKHKTLTFRFSELTGADIEAVEQEMQDMGKYALSPEISSVFQSMLAARAAKVGSDEIRRLPVADYMKIKNETRDFLTGMGY